MKMLITSTEESSMAKINNDEALKRALDALPVASQRILAARFVGNLLHLSKDGRVKRAVEAAATPECSPEEMEEAYRAVKAYSVQTFTACGRDADWASQAEHFVAAAALAALLPEKQLGDKHSLAWKAAMQARMAKNCEMILNDQGELDNEAQRQYVLTEAFLAE
jgi:hypothetical protein